MDGLISQVPMKILIQVDQITLHQWCCSLLWYDKWADDGLDNSVCFKILLYNMYPIICRNVDYMDNILHAVLAGSIAS